MDHHTAPRAFLLLCDACCDRAGVLKECLKTGGCTCDICGWSCSCVLGGRQFVNHIPVGCIPAEGWDWLQRKNEASLIPLDWEALFTGRKPSAPAPTSPLENPAE